MLDAAHELRDESVDTDVAHAVVAGIEPQVVGRVAEPAGHRHAVHEVHGRVACARRRAERAPTCRTPRRTARSSGARRARSATPARSSTARRSAAVSRRRTARATPKGTGNATGSGAPRGSGARRSSSRAPRRSSAPARAAPPSGRGSCGTGAAWHDRTCSSRRKGQRTGRLYLRSFAVDALAAVRHRHPELRRVEGVIVGKAFRRARAGGRARGRRPRPRRPRRSA